MKKWYILNIALLVVFFTTGCNGQENNDSNYADIVVVNGKVALGDDSGTMVEALAVKDGKIMASGTSADMEAMTNENTQVIDAEGKTVIPGLNDSHLHLTRGGRFYNAELRWDGVKTLKRALEMLKEQAERTPDGQWVRVIGGWSPHQFEEKRFPTPEEINQATGDVPTYVLFLYSRGWLNQAALDALGIDENTEAPEGSTFEKGPDGKLTGVLLAEPNPSILYARIGALPPMTDEEVINSTKHFYRELNRFGVTSGIDAGGGGHKFPKNYLGTKALATDDEMPIRLSYYLFPQNKGNEYAEFQEWMSNNTVFQQEAEHLAHGYELEGGGEFLVWSAGDFENFLAPQPMLKDRDTWRADLKKVTRLLIDKEWPFRIHATYGESIANILDVFEEVNEETNNGFSKIRWIVDHAETAQDTELQRIKALNGGYCGAGPNGLCGRILRRTLRCRKGKTRPPPQKNHANGHSARSGHRWHARGQLQSLARPPLAGDGQNRRGVGVIRRRQPAFASRSSSTLHLR